MIVYYQKSLLFDLIIRPASFKYNLLSLIFKLPSNLIDKSSNYYLFLRSPQNNLSCKLNLLFLITTFEVGYVNKLDVFRL